MLETRLTVFSLALLLSCAPANRASPTTPGAATGAPAQPESAAAGPPLATGTEQPLGPLPAVLDAAAKKRKADEIDKRPVDFTFETPIPMRDGQTLAARIYRPTDAVGPVPALLVKTPYNASSYHRYGMYFARRGYAVALVDARGRGNSTGDFRAFETDGRDGFDVVEWLAARSWCNGKVGMFGGSYDGFGQWATYKEQPPHLATIVPVASVGPGIDFPMWNNITYPYAIRWLTYVSSKTLNGDIFGDDSLWAPAFLESATGKIAYRDLDDRVGNPSPTFDSWQKHPTFDGFWRAKMPSPADWKNNRTRVLTITGHYDDDQPGAMHYYRSHMAHGNKRAKQQHHLVIGPWDHSGTRRPKTEFGGLRVGANSVVDILDLHRQWYDWTLKGRKRPSFLSKRVAYYVVGASQWRHADSLAGATTGKRVLYLDSEGRADDVWHSGRLVAKAPPASRTDSYRVNPLDPRLIRDVDSGGLGTFVNRLESMPPAGTSLVYHSAPFGKATEIIGGAKLEFTLEMDVPDTDFWIGIFEVRADGRSLLLTSTALRARDQGGLKKAGQRFRYRLDDFTYFAHKFSAGSRLRLVITPPIGKGWQRNFQSGGTVAEETAKDARTATLKLHHGGEHRSALTLGVLQSQPK